MVLISGFYSNHCWLLQHLFLVVMVHISGCHGTRFSLLLYTLSFDTVLVSGRLLYSFLVVTLLLSGCYSRPLWLLQYLFPDIMVPVSGCLSTCFWLLWLLRVLTVFLVVTASFIVVALLQYSFLVVTVLFSGSNSTRFWLLQYCNNKKRVQPEKSTMTTRSKYSNNLKK
jgi:hypothetical protein